MLVNPSQSIYSTQLSNSRQRSLQGCACTSLDCTRPSRRVTQYLYWLVLGQVLCDFNVRMANLFNFLFQQDDTHLGEIRGGTVRHNSPNQDDASLGEILSWMIRPILDYSNTQIINTQLPLNTLSLSK